MMSKRSGWVGREKRERERREREREIDFEIIGNIS